MKITNVGYHFKHDHPFRIDRPNGSGDWLFLFIKSPALMILNGIQKQIHPNSVIVFQQGSPQQYGSDKQPFLNDWFHFRAEEQDLALLQSLHIPTDTVLPVTDGSTLSQLIQSISYEYRTANPYKEKTVALYGTLVLLKLAENLNREADANTNGYRHQLEKLRTEIYAAPSRPWNVTAVAKQLALSESYFQHLYTKLFQVSLIRDVINSRIEHARYLLSSTTHTVSAVARQCGYQNDVHFMRQFKTEVGLTPSQYRKRNLEQIVKFKKKT